MRASFKICFKFTTCCKPFRNCWPSKCMSCFLCYFCVVNRSSFSHFCVEINACEGKISALVFVSSALTLKFSKRLEKHSIRFSSVPCSYISRIFLHLLDSDVMLISCLCLFAINLLFSFIFLIVKIFIDAYVRVQTFRWLYRFIRVEFSTAPNVQSFGAISVK